MDSIVVKGLPVMVRLGINVAERNQPQRIFLDMELFLDLKESGEVDDINRTVNYRDVCYTVYQNLGYFEFETIERVAELTATKIKSKFSVNSVKITVKKPQALQDMGVEYAAVTITR